MKKVILFLASVAVFAACHRKAAPTGDADAPTGNDSKTKTETKTTSGDNTKPATMPAGDNKLKPSAETKPPEPESDLFAGKSVYVTKCTKCHELKQPNNYTKDQWNNILKSMIPKAKLSAEEGEQVRVYLMAQAK